MTTEKKTEIYYASGLEYLRGGKWEKFIRYLKPFSPIIAFFRKLIYKLPAKRLKEEQREHSFGIVAIAKNEGAYIGEWLRFHKLAGVDKIILYNNDSTDNMQSELSEEISNGFVIYNEIHGKARQLDAYNDALKRYGDKFDMLAFIDCDEFLYSLRGGSRRLKGVF